MVKGMSGATAAALWLTMSLEWRSGRRKQYRRGNAMSWSSSYTQPPNSHASIGNPARTSQTHLPYSQYWELWRCCISGICDPAQALSALLAIVLRAWEIHMLLIYSVSYIWDRKSLYGSRGGWNISILTGRQLHVVIVGTYTAVAWAGCAMLPVLPIQVGLQAVLCCTNLLVTGQPQADHCERSHRQLPPVPAITLLAQPCLYQKVQWEAVVQKSFVNSVVFY